MRVLQGFVASVAALALLVLGSGSAVAAEQTVNDVLLDGHLHVDNGSVTRAFQVDAPGLVESVSITIDVSKYHDNQYDGGGCEPFAPSSGRPYFDELGLYVTSPSGSRVALVRARHDVGGATFIVGGTGSGARTEMTVQRLR